MIGRTFVIWLVLLVLAILNGAFREAVINPRLGTTAGHVVSTLLLSAAIALLARLSLGWIGARTPADGAVVGVVWLVLTVAFEFLAGHYLFGDSWEKLLADYNILAGRVWVAVPLATLLAPIAAASRLKG